MPTTMKKTHLHPSSSALACAAGLSALFVAGCGGGGGGGGGTAPGSQVSTFEIETISVQENDTWQINRPIEFTFSKPVDFSTVNLNTIRFQDAGGLPASGEFFLKETADPDMAGRVVVFQPTCPTLDDFSDAGFQPGGVGYQIQVLGATSGALTVASLEADADFVQTSITRNFVTPSTLTSQALFLDTVVGPPAPVVRPAGSSDLDATYLELAEDDANRVYFEFDAANQTFTQPADQPINLFSDISSHLAFVVEINQPVNPSSTNINSGAIYLEFETSPGSWEPVATDVLLERNCTQTGATVRLTPIGILPQQSRVRAVISPAFEDLTGDRNLLPIDGFAIITSETVNFASLPEPEISGDEIREDFNVGGTQIGSLEDSITPLDVPRAAWSNGILEATFEFEGTGGPGGNFDFFVPADVTIVIDTTADTIFGGPNALPSDFFTAAETLDNADNSNNASQTIINGVINCRNFGIAPGGILQVQGPNPLVIQCTGKAVIRGTLAADGSNALNVATLNTGNQPEPGAAGQGGGGSGGDGSFLTTTSTPKGGDGAGAYEIPNLGGRGGESGYATGGKNNRRPGGGGGGTFANGDKSSEGSGLGLVAENGHNGNVNSNSAITFTKPALGGAFGPGPFLDENPDNDFLGTAIDPNTGELIVGELQTVWAGAGGGGGGDAIPANQFPHPSWGPGTDEKGSGGGGGAGGIRIQALERIRIAGQGEIRCEGGRGGSGENTIFNDRIGGGSGGGSGGHIILETSTLDFTGSSAQCLSAPGGKHGNGANETSNSTNAGGDGGPGVIQIHVPDPDVDIVLPGVTLATRARPDAITLLPIFGPRSRALSEWIPLGGATVDPGGLASLVDFAFGGTDTTTGLVQDLDANELVDDLASILGGAGVDTDPSDGSDVVPYITADGRSLVVDATSLAGAGFNDVYLRNPALVRNFALVLSRTGDPNTNQRFVVEAASYDEATGEMTLTIGTLVPDLFSFPSGGGVDFSVLPRFFEVETSGTTDSLPSTASVTITFEGAEIDANGDPVTDTLLVESTADANDLNVAGVAFFRFTVDFDINTDPMAQLSANSPRPGLRFLRVPIRF